MLSVDVTSRSSGIASPPISKAASVAVSPRRSAIPTRAPSEANRAAVSRPIPEPAPVINATLPSRRPLMASIIALPRDAGKHERNGHLRGRVG